MVSTISWTVYAWEDLAGFRAMRRSSAREEQAQVVGDLGHRSDGRPGTLSQGALFDRDGRRQTLDAHYAGLRQLIEELPGISGERLHVPPLALGVDRVERER